jgi:hypothetical protein
MTSAVSPPPEEIDSVRIHVYAAIDEDVEWRGRIGGPIVLVDGRLVGPVPRLAIGLNYDGKDWLLLYCTADWESLAAVGSSSFDDAKARAEQEYRGISSKWIDLE